MGKRMVGDGGGRGGLREREGDNTKPYCFLIKGTS